MREIFAYLNFRTPKKRSEIISILIQGLRQMKRKEYHLPGMSIDGGANKDCPHDETFLLRKAEKVSILADSLDGLDMDMVYEIYCEIAYTCWVINGSPQNVNNHLQHSNNANDFVVVSNGFITSYREIKEYLLKKGHKFESETDTEVIAKLTQHVYDRYPDFSFRQLVEIVIQQLEGAFALAFKSRKFPGQLVASRRGSPLLVGIKSNSRLITNQFPVSFSKARRFASTTATHLRDESFVETPNILDLSTAANRNGDTTRICGVDFSDWEAEYFFASDAAAIVEHTTQFITLQDGDIAVVKDGALRINYVGPLKE